VKRTGPLRERLAVRALRFGAVLWRLGERVGIDLVGASEGPPLPDPARRTRFDEVIAAAVAGDGVIDATACEFPAHELLTHLVHEHDLLLHGSNATSLEVIEPRAEELYSLVQAELRRSGFEELLSSGIVITGGSSSLQGMVELGEEIFHMPVRLGLPNYRGSLEEVVLTPRCSTGIGLILAGMEQLQRQQHTRLQGNSFKRILERMKSWFQVNF